MADKHPPEDSHWDGTDQANFDVSQNWVREHAIGEQEGLFGPESLSWEIFGEPLTLLGAPAAVLMQFAHPAIAEGVRRHSNFRNDLIGRTLRTFQSLSELVFGDLDTCLTMSQRLFKIHHHIRGIINDPSTPHHQRGYRANSTDLQWWVAATFAVCSTRAFELTVRPLSPNERVQLNSERVKAGVGVGILPSEMPPTPELYQHRFDKILKGPELVVGDAARELAHILLNSRWTLGPVDDLLATGLLPPSLRAAYDLPWGRAEQRAFDGLIRSLRASRRVLPAPWRNVVAWHQAHLRLARARGERGRPFARALNRVDALVDLPMSLEPVSRLMF